MGQKYEKTFLSRNRHRIKCDSATFVRMIKAERIIALNGLECYARIGVYEEERIEGGPFCVDIEIYQPCEVREEAVELNETVDYEKLLALVQDIMEKPEFLLETVANRIVLRCREQFPQATSMMVSIQKMNPPMKAEVDSSSVTLDVSFE